jgi:hypothetical protein
VDEVDVLTAPMVSADIVRQPSEATNIAILINLRMIESIFRFVVRITVPSASALSRRPSGCCKTVFGRKTSVGLFGQSSARHLIVVFGGVSVC